MPTLSRASALWLLWIPLGFSLLVILPASTLRLTEMLGGPAVIPTPLHFATMPTAIIAHIVASVGFGILAPIQVHAMISGRRRGLHRRLGKPTFAFALAMAVTGLWAALALPTAPDEHPSLNTIRALAALAMLVCLIVSLRALRTHSYSVHAAWSLRGYGMGMGAITQAFFLIPLEGVIDDLPNALHVGLLLIGWLLGLGLAEWLIRKPGRDAMA